MFRYFMDAHNGQILFSYDNLQTAMGTSLYSGTIDISTVAYQGKYYMENMGQKHGTFDYRNKQ